MRKVTAAILILLLLLSGCGESSPITFRTFVLYTETLGLTVEDITENYTADVSNAMIATNDKLGMQVEFYEFVAEAGSTDTFSDSKAKIKELSPSIEMSVSNKYQEKYTGKTDKMYYVVSRIDNTVIYAESIRESEKELDELLKKLGY